MLIPDWRRQIESATGSRGGGRRDVKEAVDVDVVEGSERHHCAKQRRLTAVRSEGKDAEEKTHERKRRAKDVEPR